MHGGAVESRIRGALWGTVLACIAMSGAARAGETEEGTEPAAPPAAEERAEATTLDPVVVTATRREMLMSDVPDVLQVVTREEIEALRPSSLGEVMEYLPGVNIETGTGSGLPKRSVVSLNGLPPNYTLVLVDGVRLLSEHIHTGQNIEMVPPGSIERIEVVRGAASAQYGADAIGGVVNIITRKCGDKPETTVGTSAGSYHTYEGDVTLLRPASDAVRVSLSLHREQSDGVPLLAPAHRLNNMGYERHSGIARIDVDLDESTSLFGWINAVDNTVDWRDADADSELVMTALGGTRKLSPEVDLFSQFSYSKWQAETSGEENKWVQPETHLTWRIDEANTLTGGLEYRYNEFARTGVDDVPDQDAVGAFVQHEWHPREDLTLMGALRLDDVEDVDTAVSPKVSALYSPEEVPVRLRGSIARGFHAPTLQELYEEAYGHGGAALRFGNPDLDPEYSMTYAMGAEVFPTEDFQVMVYLQYSDIDDMIVPVYEGAWAEDPTKDVWRRTNIEHAWVFSGEFSARYIFSPNLTLESGYTYTNNEDEDTGHQLPYDPGDSIFAKALTDWELDRDWKLSGFIGLRAVFDRSAWSWKPPAGAPAGDPSGLTTDLDDYEKLDTGITLTYRKDLSFFVNVYNILGQDFENLDDSYTILDGEPTFKVGLKWDF